MLSRDAASGAFQMGEDGSLVTEGGYLCYLDSSPKLPSSLLANHIADRVLQLSTSEQVLNVLLIRSKVSKLSPAVSLDGAL